MSDSLRRPDTPAKNASSCEMFIALFTPGNHNLRKWEKQCNMLTKKMYFAGQIASYSRRILKLKEFNNLIIKKHMGEELNKTYY